MRHGAREAMRRHGHDTHVWQTPWGTRSRSTARLTSEVGDVMVPEHGRRAWVLGQGQAATGTNTHSTSCGATESKSESARGAGRRAATAPGPPASNTSLPLQGRRPRGGASPEGPSTSLLRAGVRRPRPLGTGAAGPRALPVPSWGLLGIQDAGGGQLARLVCADCPRQSPGLTSRDPGLGPLGLPPGWGQSTSPGDRI